MCGIAAVWGADASPLAQDIAAKLTHRGPDDSGTHAPSGTALALSHRRLAIMDPDGGQQPLLDRPRTAALVANGMIYNDPAIREKYGRSSFRTSSDSESILRVCTLAGASGVATLDGMFAFVCAHKQQLLAARDPLGIKPLYIGRRGDTLMMASEIKALLGHADEISEFPAGHVFDTTHGLRRYFTLPTADPDLSNPAKAAAAIRTALEAAVEKRLRADVPLGVFLSGGLDSSIIAALASRHRPGLKTFAVGLPGSADLIAAREVATHLGTEHYEYELDPAEIAADLPRILFHLESYDQDLVRSAIPCYYVSRLAAEHVKVVLTGEGADELFAGYTYHKTYMRDDRLEAELRRSLTTMHDINLQRVDRMTMAHGLEARVPFLDVAFITTALRVPAALKLKRPENIEKWILRDACADLLPAHIVWRHKAQFDEGSGVATLLQSYDHGGATRGDEPCRSAEERYYRATLASQFEQPDLLLNLVSHWADNARVDDEPPPIRASVTNIGHSIDRGRENNYVALNDFSALYDQPTGHAYFRRMAEVDYQIPRGAARVYRWCIDTLRDMRAADSLSVLDLCAGYGVNGALLKSDLSLDTLYRYCKTPQELEAEAACLFDRLFMANRWSDRAIRVIGLDIASNALEYAQSVGFIDGHIAVNLEEEPLPRAGAALIRDVALITVTGGFSFIGHTSFERLLRSITARGAALPWIVGFPLRHTDLSALTNTLEGYGYALQPDTGHRFRQRRFATARERASEHNALRRNGETISDESYFEARLLVAQPPGAPDVPTWLLDDAATRRAAART